MNIPPLMKLLLYALLVWIVCYALNINPIGIFQGIAHGLQQMHQSTTGIHP
jgi:hypothetical protein